ncbi:MAG: hypothetical protein AAF078_11945 [Planctomycetota bacterium]
MPELMLALAGTSLVGMAVTTMLFAAGRGGEEEQAVRSLVVESKVVTSRLNASLRSCRRVLSVSGTRVILWTGDTDNDGLVDADELGIIDHDAANTQLAYSTPTLPNPAEWDAATENFTSATLALQATDNLDTTVWSNRVDVAVFTTDSPGNPVAATLIAYRIEITRGTLTETTSHSVALRNHEQN